MAMKVLELEGMYGIGFMGSMDNLTKLMKAFDACDMVDVRFHHVPEGESGYYAVPCERSRAMTLKEHPTLTLAEYVEMERLQKEINEGKEPAVVGAEACDCGDKKCCDVCQDDVGEDNIPPGPSTEED